MKRSVETNRRSKKSEVITISDDDSSSEQPAVKNKKRDGPVHSPEVIELQLKNRKLEEKVVELEQKLDKSEKIAQGACRIAGEAQARIQFLENLIDTKPKVVYGVTNNAREAELEKKIKELTAKLDQYEGMPQPPPIQQLQQTPAAILTMQQPLGNSFLHIPNAPAKNERIAAEADIPPVTTPAISPLESGNGVMKNSAPVPTLLPHILLSGSEENLVHDEQTRWSYGESQKRGTASSMTTSDIDPTPKRQKIDDQLNELSPQQTPAALELHLATSPPSPMQENIPTAAQSPLVQQPQLNTASTATTVSLRAKFSDISKLKAKKIAHSETTEFDGMKWTISMFNTNTGTKPYIVFSLLAQKESAIEWSCQVNVQLQFISQKTEEVVFSRSAKKHYSDAKQLQAIAGCKLTKLEDDGCVVDDSITVDIVIKALHNN